MKKLIATLFALTISACIYALPVGNPWDASLLCDGIIWEGYCADNCDPCCSWYSRRSLRVGFYGDYVFNRHLQIDSGSNDSNLSASRLYTNAGFLALNFCDRIDIFATLGATQIDLEGRMASFGNTVGNETAFIGTDTNFSWSLGLRGTLWQCGCFGFGLEGQYFQARPHLNYVRAETQEIFYVDDSSRVRYQEWQVGVGASYRVNIGCNSTALVPYIAIKWAGAHVDMGNVVVPIFIDGVLTSSLTLFDLENARTTGYAVGMTLVGCNKASVTVEGRFADEKAVYVNSQFRF